MEKYKWLDEFCLAMKGAEKDYKVEWEVYRYMIRGKMFVMVGGDKNGKEIITLKLDPMFSQQLRIDYEEIIPGYYMNKLHWNSIYIDGNVSDDLLKNLITQSYDLILSGFSKKIQEEIKFL